MSPAGALRAVRDRAARALSSCLTEADVVQVLYAELHPVFGYGSINLHVLEREGWFHSQAIDRGVVQDVTRVLLAESFFVDCYRDPKPYVFTPTPTDPYLVGRGPGSRKHPAVAIWIPIKRGDQLVGAVSYYLQTYRDVPPEELELLESVHEELGVLVVNAYLNELTRNQAVSLGALNAIARALSACQDEAGVVEALVATLSPLIPVDSIELVVREDASQQLRLFRSGANIRMERVSVPARARRLGPARDVIATGRPRVSTHQRTEGQARAAASVAVVEGGVVRGALTTWSSEPEAYEPSTLVFLQQVADQVALALRNAWSYTAIERQRRRLEIVNAVGSRLASSLDRWSIVRALREELARHLDFDLFTLATVTEAEQGPMAEGYVWDSGEERPLPPVQLTAAGPSREAYEGGEPVLIRRSPWARGMDTGPRSGGRIVGEGVVVDITRPGRHRRVAARSILWVPVRHGEEVVALLSLQSYRADLFDEWHAQVLQDVANHVGLALANAEHFHAAQLERQRLQALHLLEMGVAPATDEAQIAEALVRSVQGFFENDLIMFGYLLPHDLVAGYCCEPGEEEVRALPPVSSDWARYLKRLIQEGESIVEPVPSDLRVPSPQPGWPTWGPFIPTQVLIVPVFNNEGRVVGGISAQRREDVPYTSEQVQLMESAAPVVGIALRNVRLHRANELAAAHSVRLQMVAGQAGNDLASVLGTVAQQAQTMLDATGVACWAFDDDGRVTAESTCGGGSPRRVLRWSGRTSARSWDVPPRAPVLGLARSMAWTLVPLWYGERLVGAVGAAHPPGGSDEPLAAVGDFARHAAIAIENAHLARETRRLVAEVNRQAEMLGTVLRHSPVGVVLEDEQGEIAYANPEMERIYGVPADHLPGARVAALLEQAGAAEVESPDPEGPLEVRLEARDLVVRLRRAPIPGPAGQPERALTLHQDVTRERAVLEAKELMLQAIGHEVASPAAAMRSTLAGLLQWGALMESEQRHTLLAEAYEQSERLLSLVENQLLIAKLETRRFEPRPAPIGLPRVVEQVMTVLRNRHGGRADVVTARIRPSMPDAFCEPSHLEQVLTNLIGNALEYTRGSRVSVTAAADGGWLEVTVADDGQGVAVDRQASLFSKTAPAGRNRARGGLGLGLYLCRLVVERSFGGRIWLHDTGPAGTTFKFTVPSVAGRGGTGRAGAAGATGATAG